MKKILISIFSMLLLASCSLLQVSSIFVSNETINREASKAINISTNLIVANASLTNESTRVQDGRVLSKLRYSYNILGGLGGSSSGYVNISSGLRVEDNKLFLSNPQVLSITTNDGKTETPAIANAITSIILNSIAYTPIYDFGEENYNINHVEFVQNGLRLSF